MRKYGLACDNLVSADLITADGKFLKASAEQNQDLFWGIRGGGGNFGIHSVPSMPSASFIQYFSYLS
jgi:FAD/FMN-containing dehydrogenase